MQIEDIIYRMLTYSLASTMICCLIILLYKFLYRRGHKVQCSDIFIITILVMLSSLRYNVGSDYTRYMASAVYSVRHFSDLNVLFSKQILDEYSYEIGYQLLAVIGGHICDSPYTIFWLVSLIIYPAIVLYGRKHTGNALYALSFYLLFGFWGMSLNVLKQAIAMVFILYGYNFLRNKKYLKYVGCSLFAVLFHISSIIAILGVIIANLKIIKPTKKVFWLFIIAGIVLRFSYNIITSLLSHAGILGKYLNYFANENADRISRSFIWIGALIETVIVCIIIYLSVSHIEELRERSSEADNVIVLIMIGIPLSIMGISPTMWIANRLAKDFFLFLIILWPILLDKMGHIKQFFQRKFIFNYNKRFALWLTLVVWHALYSILMVDNSGYTIQTYLFM